MTTTIITSDFAKIKCSICKREWWTALGAKKCEDSHENQRARIDRQETVEV